MNVTWPDAIKLIGVLSPLAAIVLFLGKLDSRVSHLETSGMRPEAIEQRLTRIETRLDYIIEREQDNE